MTEYPTSPNGRQAAASAVPAAAQPPRNPRTPRIREDAHGAAADPRRAMQQAAAPGQDPASRTGPPRRSAEHDAAHRACPQGGTAHGAAEQDSPTGRPRPAGDDGAGAPPAGTRPDARLCAALLDLVAALRLDGRDPDEVLPVLDRAEAAAGGDDGLRLRCLLDRARVRTGNGAWEEADRSYAAAASLTRRDTRQRREVLAEWGELLLRQAVSDGEPASVERAE
ncbi:hypothetical protein ACTWQE_24405, partial [Streptomyces sp. 8N706]